MGADWYTFSSYTAVAIPVPKEALRKLFDIPGFKLMTIEALHYDSDNGGREYNQCHGALICLSETQLFPTSVKVIGPYVIEHHEATCERLQHLDVLMTGEIKRQLLDAFETYTGRQSENMPGFWTVCATRDDFVGLQTTWSLEVTATIVNKAPEYEDYFGLSVVRDNR